MVFKSVRPLLIWAVVIVMLFGLANALGLRGYMTVLSGTMPSASAGVTMVLCVVYLALYLGAVLAAPILILATLIELAVRRVAGRSAAYDAGRAGRPSHDRI